MKIIVLVKHVPDAQFDRHLSGEGNTTDRSESILSELDEYALEAALQLVEARGGAKAGNKVIALSMGPAGAVNAVKKSLQIGATEGVHLSDDALAGSDAAATSLALAAAIRHLGADAPVDLVLTGMASTDGETSLVPAQLAERLDLPQVTFASALELDGGKLTARRDGDSHADTIEADPARRGLGHGPDQRTPLPQLQGHHGGQEEDHHHADPGRHRRRPGRRWATSGSWTAVGGRRGTPAAHRRHHHHRRRRRRHQAGRVPGRPEAALRGSPNMAKVLVFIDNPGQALKKSSLELLTIARSLGEPAVAFNGELHDDVAGTLGEYGAQATVPAVRRGPRRLPRRAQGRLPGRRRADLRRHRRSWPRTRPRARKSRPGWASSSVPASSPTSWPWTPTGRPTSPCSPAPT